jgi:hypothetical protein
VSVALDVFTLTTKAAFVSANWLSSASARDNAKRRVMVPNAMRLRGVVMIQFFPVSWDE